GAPDLLDLALDLIELRLARHVLERALELPGHRPALGDPLPHGSRHARQVLGPDDDQRHQEDDRHLGPADVEHDELAASIQLLLAVSSRFRPAWATSGSAASEVRTFLSSSSSSRMPALKFFTPLATSPITFGSLPAPNRMRTISRISTTCQIPMLIGNSLVGRSDLGRLP